jgi:hypothetical protein
VPLRRCVALITAVASLALAPSAGAITFGADLSTPANNPDTCSQLNADSCTFFSGSPGPGYYTPANGTVSRVRVKVGATTGPMQIVVMRSLYQNRPGEPGRPYFYCCFVERYGPTFTPGANTITQVPTSLPMVADPTPAADDFQSIARGDFLALSVLAPNVPFPATNDSGSFFSIFAPALTPSTAPAPSQNAIAYSGTGSGFHMLLQGDLDVGSTSGGNPVPGTTAPLTISDTGRLVGTTASVPLECVGTTACTGNLKLTNGKVAKAAKKKKSKKKKVTVYGSKRYKIPAGKTKRVKVKLNRAGRRKLGKHSKITLTATTKINSQVIARRVKFKRAKHK